MRGHDERRRSLASLVVSVGVAVVLHAGAWFAIPDLRNTVATLTNHHSELVEITVVPEEAPPVPEPETPPAPEPEPEPEPEPPAPVVHRETVARNAAPEPSARAAAPTAEPPAAAETPVDFDGLVLGSDSSSSWSTQQASGAARGALIGRPGATVTGRSRVGTEGGVAGATGSGPALVAEADLRRGPRSPGEALNGLLQRNYPEEAKRQGISGRARVAVILGSDGRVRSMRVIRETPTGQGFGRACRKTLLDSPAWDPAIGPDGRPAATEIKFDCEFDVNQ